MKHRLYLLNNTFPKKVSIGSGKNCETKDILSLNEFLSNLPTLFAESKSGKVVRMFIEPSFCRQLYFPNYFTKASMVGWVDLKDFQDVAFYDYDEKTDTENFVDLFKNYLSSDNPKIKLAISGGINSKSLEYQNMIILGDNLLRFLVADAIYSDNDVLKIKQLENFFLTDFQLKTMIAPNYGIEENDEAIGKIKAVLYAIYVLSDNLEDLKQIIRHFIDLTFMKDLNLDAVREEYSKLFEHLQNRNDVIDDKISFDEIGEAIGHKPNYAFFVYYDYLADCGCYKIKTVDFDSEYVTLEYNYE